MGSRVSGDKAYKGLSAFVRAQWWGYCGEYGEVKFVCCPLTPSASCRLLLQNTVHGVPAALHDFLTGRLFGLCMGGIHTV